MSLPRLYYAFITFGKLGHGTLIISVFLLISCSYFANRYLGMNALTTALDNNTGKKPPEKVASIRANEITMKSRGSLIIGGISAINFVHSIYGILGVLMSLPEFLFCPMVLLPISAFICLLLIFYDLGIKDSAGFLYFYVLTGFVCKIAMAGFFFYCFLVVYSYYMDLTETPEEKEEREEARQAALEEKRLQREREAELERQRTRPPYTPRQTLPPIKITMPPITEQVSPPKRPPPPRPPPPKRSPKK